MRRYTDGSGKYVQLYFADADYVIADRYPNEAISLNGTHFGYLYDGYVYCNIYPEGLPYEIWVNQFHVHTGSEPQVYVYY